MTHFKKSLLAATLRAAMTPFAPQKFAQQFTEFHVVNEQHPLDGQARSI
jgi:hypothetical protein